MKKTTIKKIVLYAFSTIVFFTLVLAVHIYLVYRPKAPTPTSKIMARIDIKEQISEADSAKITSWMYGQTGVDHVLVNPESRIVIFTFYPLKTTANQLVANFKSELPFSAQRIIPSANDLKNGCPAAASSYAYKIYKVIANII